MAHDDRASLWYHLDIECWGFSTANPLKKKFFFSFCLRELLLLRYVNFSWWWFWPRPRVFCWMAPLRRGGESFNQIWPIVSFFCLVTTSTWMISIASCGRSSLSFRSKSPFQLSIADESCAQLGRNGDDWTKRGRKRETIRSRFKVHALLLSWATLPGNNDAYRLDRFQSKSLGHHPTGTPTDSGSLLICSGQEPRARVSLLLSFFFLSIVSGIVHLYAELNASSRW